MNAPVVARLLSEKNSTSLPIQAKELSSSYAYLLFISSQVQYTELDFYHLTRRSSLGCSPKGFYCILFLPGLFQDRMVRG